MPSITITWKTRRDIVVCPICKALEGYKWTFTTPEPLPTQLTGNGQVVWNIGQGSRAHGHEKFNCRCSLKMEEPNLSDVHAWVEKKTRELEAMVHE